MRRPRLVVVLAVGVVLAATLILGALLTQPRVPADAIALTFACPEPVASVDLPRITARIDDVRIRAVVERADDSHLRVHVADAQGRELVRSLFDAHRLEVRRVDEAAMQALVARVLPPGVTASTSPRPELSSVTRAPLAALGGATGIRCEPDHGCRAWALGARVLGSEDVADASASHDVVGARLAITLTSASQSSFARFTAGAVGARLAFLVDDHVMMVPVVQTAITGGHLSIALGESDGGFALADATASALRLGPLACSRWTAQ